MIVVAAFARHRGTLMLDGETGPTLCNRARTFADRNIPDLSDMRDGQRRQDIVA